MNIFQLGSVKLFLCIYIHIYIYIYIFCSLRPQTVWVKKGKMQWWRESKRFKWVDCNIELVREAEDQGARGYFIIYYRYRNQQMVNSAKYRKQSE